MKSRTLPLLVALMGLGVVVGISATKRGKKAVSAESLAKVSESLPKEFAKPKAQRKLLVFSKTNGFRHKSIELGNQALMIMGEKTGAYTAVVSDDLSNFEKDKISEFDAICFNNTTREVFRPHKAKFKLLDAEQQKAALEKEKELQQNFANFIKNGGGFIGIHAATDTFYEWPEYGQIIGGYFDGHPWRHGNDVSIKVDDSAKGNAIVAALQDGESLNFKEEIYQLKEPYDSSKLDMLLRLDTEKTDMNVKGVKRTDGDFGVSWTKSYGDGRVFYCSLGHNDHIYWNPKVLSIYLNGIQWAMGDLEK